MRPRQGSGSARPLRRRDAAVKEADAGEWQARPVSLERVARLTAFLETSEYRFDEVERLRQQGQRWRAAQTLSAFSEQEIDGTFQPLVDAAIGTERDNARAARERLETLMERSRWIAVAASAIAALFAIISGMFLLRGFRNPVEALMQGTDAIASGNLAHRIALPRQDEFGYLATHFNHMACELERQQARLKEGKAVLEQRVAERTVELHRLNGELLRLRQVLFILGDNAIRYSNPGGHIAVTLHTGENSATFSVADQGIGIPAEDLGLVFDRHFRSANARRSRHDGAGLGLPMARAILQAHGGQIVVASVEGAGSTFTATLPLASTEQ